LIKLKKIAFSGGKQTKLEHRKFGTDLSIDVAYQYLFHFMDDDNKLEEIAIKYRNGEIMTSDIKEMVSDICWKYIENHQIKVNNITDKIIDDFFDINLKCSSENLNIPDKNEIYDVDVDYNKYGFDYDCYFGSSIKKIKNVKSIINYSSSRIFLLV
jgi:tryptophanyl-tRNA synthetase